MIQPFAISRVSSFFSKMATKVLVFLALVASALSLRSKPLPHVVVAEGTVKSWLEEASVQFRINKNAELFIVF